MWFVYVLLCVDNSFYVGVSDDPERRFSEHKNGKGGKYTRSHKPLKLIYLEQLLTKQEAIKREKQIKGWSRAKKIQILGLKV